LKRRLWPQAMLRLHSQKLQLALNRLSYEEQLQEWFLLEKMGPCGANPATTCGSLPSCCQNSQVELRDLGPEFPPHLQAPARHKKNCRIRLLDQCCLRHIYEQPQTQMISVPPPFAGKQYPFATLSCVLKDSRAWTRPGKPVHRPCHWHSQLIHQTLLLWTLQQACKMYTAKYNNFDKFGHRETVQLIGQAGPKSNHAPAPQGMCAAWKIGDGGKRRGTSSPLLLVYRQQQWHEIWQCTTVPLQHLPPQRKENWFLLPEVSWTHGSLARDTSSTSSSWSSGHPSQCPPCNSGPLLSQKPHSITARGLVPFRPKKKKSH
jgi:hypothetical protein